MKINSNKLKSLFLLSLLGSGTGQQSTDNQTEVLVDSGTNHPVLPQLVTNFTYIKMAQEDDPKQDMYIAGTPILSTFKRKDGSLLPSKKCTSGFSIVKTGGCSDYNFGFLTSIFCIFSDDERDISSYDIQMPLTGWDNSAALGYLYS